MNRVHNNTGVTAIAIPRSHKRLFGSKAFTDVLGENDYESTPFGFGADPIDVDWARVDSTNNAYFNTSSPPPEQAHSTNFDFFNDLGGSLDRLTSSNTFKILLNIAKVIIVAKLLWSVLKGTVKTGWNILTFPFKLLGF